MRLILNLKIIENAGNLGINITLIIQTVEI